MATYNLKMSEELRREILVARVTMPTYLYNCNHCGDRLAQVRAVDDRNELRLCPTCKLGGTIRDFGAEAPTKLPTCPKLFCECTASDLGANYEDEKAFDQQMSQMASLPKPRSVKERITEAVDSTLKAAPKLAPELANSLR